MLQVFAVSPREFEVSGYSLYAQDSVLKYIKKGVQDKLLPGNFTHGNIALDVYLLCPVIIVPIDVFNYNNTECI